MTTIITTLTPGQLFTIAVLGGAAGVLALALLLVIGYAVGVTLLRAFDHLYEKRQQWQDARRGRRARREFERITALYDQPAHDPRDPR